MTDTKYRALVPKWVVPVVPEGLVLTNHAVVLDDRKIVDLIDISVLSERYPEASVERFPNHAIMPGLVNAHGHSPMVLMRGLADDLPLMV